MSSEATVECVSCGEDIPITIAEIMNDCIIECPDCKTQYQLNFKYYMTDEETVK